MRRKVLSPPGADPWELQRPLDAVGELRDVHQRKKADRLGAGLEHVLANKGTASTCVAWRGSSVVVVTWAISDLYARIRDWRVA
jgi:hypothetical protein